MIESGGAKAACEPQPRLFRQEKITVVDTLISSLRSEIEMKLQYAIRGASRGGICLADSEAQGSAVRQSLCADCQLAKLAY